MSEQLEMFPEEKVHSIDEVYNIFHEAGLESTLMKIKVWRSKQPDDTPITDMARQAVEVTYRFRDLVQGIEGPNGEGGLYGYFDSAKL